MKVTIKDIAREAGVSISTVSYALNKKGRIVSDKHRRIIEIARKYNYVPNANARSLASGLSNNIGLLLYNSAGLTSPYILKCISTLSDIIGENYGWLALCQLKSPAIDLQDMRRYLGNSRSDGIIVFNAQLPQEVIALLSTAKTPYIVFGREQASCSYVCCDDAAGIREGFDALYARGKRKVLFISGCTEAEMDKDVRTQAYLGCIADHGLAFCQVVGGGYSREQTAAALGAYFAGGGETPQAIMAANDEMAYAAIHVLEERGLIPGQDVALIGFDDADPEHNDAIGLTSIRQPIGQMTRACIEYIYQIVEKDEPALLQQKYAPQLVVRAGTLL